MLLFSRPLCSGKFFLAATLSLTLGGLVVLAGCGGGSDSNNSSNTSGSGLPTAKANLTQVAQGRSLVVSLGCSDCHNRGKDDPADAKWLAGYLPGTPGQPYNVGPFLTYAANLTPDAATGLGSYADRQIYNALKFGLDPADTPNVTITGTTPGIGNFPAVPHYLAPPMPWTAYRHLSDGDLWAIVAYLKHGIKPVVNAVPDSTGPPDFWASSYISALVGPPTVTAYPTTSEQFKP